MTPATSDRAGESRRHEQTQLEHGSPTREGAVLGISSPARGRETPDKPFAVLPLTETGPFDAAAESRLAMANASDQGGRKSGDHVSVWVPTGPTCCRPGSGPTRPAASTRRSTLPRAAATWSTRSTSPGPAVGRPCRTGRAAGRARSPPPGDRDPDRRACSRNTTAVARPSRCSDDLLAEAGPQRPAYSRRPSPGMTSPDLHLWHDRSLEGRASVLRQPSAVRALPGLAATWDQDDRFLQPLPMFHTAGTGVTYSMLRRGGSVALVERLRPPDLLGRRSASRRDARTDHPRDGRRSCSPSRRRPTTPTTRCGSSTWARCHDVQEFCRRFGVDVSTPASG